MKAVILISVISFVGFMYLLTYALAKVSSQAEEMSEKTVIINCSDLEED